MPKPKYCSYEEFPNANDTTEDIFVIPRDDNARVLRYYNDVVYANKDGHDLHLQILVPGLNRSQTFEPGLADEKRYPLIVFVQGSAWMEQDVYFNVPQLAKFSERGYVTAIVEYRHSGIAPFPAQIEDCLSAIRFMQEHADIYQVDTEKTIVWGDSSGAHTAVMAALVKDESEWYSDKDDTHVSIDVCIDYYGPTHIGLMNEDPTTMDHDDPQSPEGLLIGGLRVSEHPQEVAPTVLMNHVTAEKDIPPIFILHGTKDRLVPFRQSILFYKKLKECGKDVKMIKLEESDHADPIVWSDAVMDMVDDFIRGVI